MVEILFPHFYRNYDMNLGVFSQSSSPRPNFIMQPCRVKLHIGSKILKMCISASNVTD